MKLLKSPVFAVLLAIVVVIVSMVINTNIKFGRKCDAVRDLFYEGVTTRGYTQTPIATHLSNLCGYADGLVTIARNYDVDGAEVESNSYYLKSSLNSSWSDISYIHSEYNRLISSLNDLIDRLERAELSERDASGVEQYKSSVTGVQSAIGEAGYNEAVREFLRRYNHFPTNYLALLADVDLPEVFA
ncbi:MAG: hypothetical protein IIU18_01880 [Oscillospiraceae bacterium]|jgi:hypothetical protein|nr:hypothetical protein [Oscillospiraceae bacterium]